MSREVIINEIQSHLELIDEIQSHLAKRVGLMLYAERAGLTIEDVAKKSGNTVEFLTKIEEGLLLPTKYCVEEILNAIEELKKIKNFYF